MNISTTEKFVRKSLKVHNNKYNYNLVNYINHKTRVNIICNKHGEFLQRPLNHLQGRNCPKCAREKASKKKRVLNNKMIIERFNKKFNNLYDYSKFDYKGYYIPSIIICNKHGEFKQNYDIHVHSKIGCPKCSNEKLNRKIFNTKDFIQESQKIHNYRYNYYKTKYNGIFKKLKIICKKHGEFKQLPFVHIKGHGCPKCKIYKGEEKIKNFLEKNDIKFINQKTFVKCKYINKLSYDFYLPNINTLIEYDGIQHYKIIGWNTEKNLKIQNKRDNIKTLFAKENNIKLLRIPYWKFNNIENILNKKLITMGV